MPRTLPASSSPAGRIRHLLAGFILAFAPHPCDAALPGAASDNWIEARTERFVVLSNAGEGTATNAARQLERLAQVLEQTTNGLRLDGARGMRVYVFRDLDSFKPYRPFGDDDNDITAGYHTIAPDVDLIAYHVPPGGESMRFAAHEYLHAVLRRSIGELPVWINEGLAEYYSTFTAGARSADIGRPIPEHIAWLREQGFMSPGALLAMTPRDREYEQGNRRGTIYAQSWALVHMLCSARDGHDPRLSVLLGAFRRRLSSDAALKLAYGPNAADSLHTALQAYVQNLAFGFSSWRFPDEFATVQVSVRTLSQAEVLTALGELAAQSKDTLEPLARAHLEAAWAADSSSGVAAALLADLADRHDHGADAERWLTAVERTAGAASRASGLAGRQLAMRPFQRGFSPSYPAEGADADARRARPLLERALSEKADEVEWLVPYGLTFVEDSTGVALGRNALFTAHDSEPARADATGGLGMIEVRIGNRAGALTLYRLLPTFGPDEVWRHWVGYLLARRTLDDALKLFRGGRPADAESLLVQLPRDVHETGVTHNADQLLTWMRTAGPGARAPAPEVETERASLSAKVREPGKRTGAGAAGAPGAPNTVPGRPAIGQSRIGRALAAARRGEFETAEQLLEAERPAVPRGEQVHLDSLLSEVRNQRRMQVTRSLVDSGRFLEACALWQVILDDRPKKDVREYVNRQRAHYCAVAPK